MKLLRSERTAYYHEIEVEYNFLGIKRRAVYRKVGDKSDTAILRYIEPNNYYNVGIGEYADILDLFKIRDHESKNHESKNGNI